MDYGRSIAILKGFSPDAASQRRVWNNIDRTLREKRDSISLLSFIWPRLLVTAAALTAVFVIYFVRYENQLEARNFVQQIYSTEYIYDICKYDGL